MVSDCLIRIIIIYVCICVELYEEAMKMLSRKLSSYEMNK